VRSWLRRSGLVATLIAVAIVAASGVSRAQSAPPCAAGTTLATVDAGGTDLDVVNTTGVTATHATELGAQLNYSDGAAISPDEQLTLTPPPGLAVTPVPNDGDPSEAGLKFTASSAGTLVFTATWTQLDNYTSQHDCTASAQVPVAVQAELPNRISHVFGAMQHWPGHKGTPLNVLSLGWTLAADAKRGDATPVTISVRAVDGRKLPTAATPAVTSAWDPQTLLARPVTAHSKLIRLRSATLGLDETATNKIDVINASVYVYPPHGTGSVRRGIAVDITEGARTLAGYRLVTKCTKRRHRPLRCSPRPSGGT
jgi:hypothetical protein